MTLESETEHLVIKNPIVLIWDFKYDFYCGMQCYNMWFKETFVIKAPLK